MKIATWNVNSVRVRAEQVHQWLERREPDVLCLQELKCREEEFPGEAFADLGYESLVLGQKTYNGVAILSRVGIDDPVRGFSDDEEEDPQSRFLRATCGGVRVANVYCPNGEALDSDKFVYKLGWFRRLRAVLDAQEDAASPFVIVGDFNIAPDDRDVYDPDGWREKIHCSTTERETLDHLKAFGLTDCLRKHHEEGEIYSWWDYRGALFWKNKGLRIDFILAAASLAEQCTSCEVDTRPRKKKRPSDHAPVIAEFEIAG